MRFVGARLRQARIARGFTAKALADAVGISASILSGYEQEKKVPTPATVDKLARLLEVPARTFSKRIPESGVDEVFYRSISSATKSLRDTLSQKAAWMCEIFDFLEEHFSFSDINLPECVSKDTSSGPGDFTEKAALLIREMWGLGNGPIPNVTDVMEANGITISKFSFDCDNMDGFSFWHRREFPMVVLANDKDSRSRSRFDLAHELGHLALRHSRGEDPSPVEVKLQEGEANKFASAFLLPRDGFMADLDQALAESNRRGVLNCLWPLKLKWKVSFAAMLYRAFDLNKINKQQFQSGYVMLSQRGWRRSEPLEEDLPEERPETLKWCIDRLVKEGDYTASEVLETLALPQKDIAEICGLPTNFFEDRQDGRRALRIRRRD